MTRTNAFLTALLIGASTFALSPPVLAQEVGIDADVGGVAGADADADISLGGDDGTTASIDGAVGDGTDASVDIGVGDGATVDADLGLLGELLGADAGVTAGGGAGGGEAGTGPATVVAAMSDSDIARYRKPCEEAVRNADYPQELLELCRLILLK